MYIDIYYAEDDGQGGIVFDVLTCRQLKDPVFSPQTDLIGTSLPINEFYADIVLDDPEDAPKIYVGEAAELLDDLGNRWASYLITYAETVQTGVVHVIAKSRLSTLDGVKMPAVMYSGDSATDVIVDCIEAGGQYGSSILDIESSLSSATITGFCPEQTARERLTWVLFAINAYVRSFFSDKIEIATIDDTETLIPADKTFWKPTVVYMDYVTAVKAKTYSFAQGTPATTDTYVEDANGVTYIVTEGAVSLTNPDAPDSVPENVVEIDGVYLLNSSNVSAILANLSTRYFKRVEVEGDIIDNAEFIPGDKVTLLTEPGVMYSGFIENAAFSFGVQARAKIKMTACENVQCARLIINCVYDGSNIGKYVYYFPVSYEYSVSMPFIDMMLNAHRYIFRPTTATVTGTMTAQGATVAVNYAVALDLYEGILHIISVDEVTVDSSGDYAIGVIA